MAVIDFTQGQRWISNTEAELGLGIVTDVASRRVTLHFPAADEARTYSTDNAPLSRVQYQPQDTIRNMQGEPCSITECIENNGCYIYIGQDNSGNELIIPENQLESAVQFNRPQDRLFAGQIDKLEQYQLRLATLEHHHRYQQSPAYGLLGARVQLLPHQLYVAHEVANRYAPRVLLADEVGLGKTIEAGLIIHQQLISGRASRILITVPDSLIYQWLVEMLRRFNLHFTVLDDLRCTGLELAEQGNPFDTAQLIICTQSLLTNPARQEQMLACQWDLLIVDEAHHLLWDEHAPSPLYQSVEALAQSIPGLLLLTATPEQLGPQSHFARLRLLDPDRYSSLAAFQEEQTHYGEINQLLQQLLADDGLTRLENDSTLQHSLINLLGDASVQPLLSADDTTRPQLLAHTLDQLLDRHGTGRVLFRNTRDTVSGFPQRVLIPHLLPQPEGFADASAAADLDQLLQPETLLGENWLATDPRIEWLVDWLQKHRTEKALLICHLADTAQQLEDYLRLRKGVRCTVFHEQMSLINRDRAAAYFADPDEYAQVLICSEIGSEGRNFQFAQHLIMFDLPLNPDLLEQRIGRLDRIGQQHDIQIQVPFYENSVQAMLVRWFDEGINAFRHTCPAGQALFSQFEDRLSEQLTCTEPTAFEALIEEARQSTATLVAELQAGRDKLLEMNACRPQQAARLVQAATDAETTDALMTYMEGVFDQFGVNQLDEGPYSVILQPTDQMADLRFPGLPDEGCSATYSREEALHREDLHFLSWEHPMVTGAMEVILGSDFGNATLCTLKLPPLQPGTLLVEAVFELYCTAPKALKVQRYQPEASVRVLLDSAGNDLSHIISAHHLNQLGQRVKRHAAQNMVRHAREQITALLNQAEAKALAQQQPLVDAAIANACTLLDEEIERTQALMAVNPAIRQEELVQLQTEREAVLAHLNDAHLRLDAIRLAVVSD